MGEGRGEAYKASGSSKSSWKRRRRPPSSACQQSLLSVWFSFDCTMDSITTPQRQPPHPPSSMAAVMLVCARPDS